MSSERSRFASRRARALEALDEGVMVLPSAPVLVRPGGSELPYRPDSELFYLTGFMESDAVLVLRAFADEDRCVLFCRAPDASSTLWTGPRMGPEAARDALGLDAAYDVDELEERLPGLLAGADHAYFRLGVHASSIERLVVSALRTARARGSRRGTGPRGVLDPGVVLDEMRLRKDPDEIEAIRRAVRVTMEGFRAGLATVAPGRGEWEVEAEIESAFRRREALAPGFATIVGSGPNTCVLHYIQNGRRMREGELVLVDAGAEVGMYSGDLTRTAPVSGRFSDVQRDLYQVVEEARSEAVDAVRPGARMDDPHKRAIRVIVRGLIDLGVISGDVDAAVEEREHEPYAPHRTSHWLGLDTHDPGDLVRNGMSRELEPGMVLTVEPGLYFSPYGEDGHHGHFTGIGIRIEDDVVVTESGADVLSAALPTAADEVEAMVGGGQK